VGSSFWSRSFVTVAFLLLSLLAWESLLLWQRYEPAGGNLGGFQLVGDMVLPQEPGGTPAQGPLLPANQFRGAQYQVLIPLAPLDRLLGAEPRCRLVGLYLGPEGGPPRLAPWGGGKDPLANLLKMTRLLTEFLFPRIAVRRYDFKGLSRKSLQRPLVLRFEGVEPVLAPGS
jgi:hypothetical protein